MFLVLLSSCGLEFKKLQSFSKEMILMSLLMYLIVPNRNLEAKIVYHANIIMRDSKRVST